MTNRTPIALYIGIIATWVTIVAYYWLLVDPVMFYFHQVHMIAVYLSGLVFLPFVMWELWKRS